MNYIDNVIKELLVENCIDEFNPLDGEEWKPLVTELYPNIKPIYIISNKNRVYSLETNKYLAVRHLNPEKSEAPYHKVTLQTNIKLHDGSIMVISMTYLMHRLMMSIFSPVVNMENLVINHKDGDKLNNDLTNLEWTTVSENALHAYQSGLFKPLYGAKHCCATISDKDADDICKLLVSRKFTHIQIAEIIGTSESIVGSIACGKSWKHISKKYDLSVLKQRIPICFTLDNIHECCRYFESHDKPDKMSIRRHCINALNFIGYKQDITESAINSIRLLFTKKRYQSISVNYNF